jgi:hypothetical protein
VILRVPQRVHSGAVKRRAGGVGTMIKLPFADDEAMHFIPTKSLVISRRGLAHDRWNYFEERSIRAASSSLDVTSAYCAWIFRSDSQY